MTERNFDYTILLNYEREDIDNAFAIANQVAAEFPPTYYCEDFLPHNWVVKAIIEAVLTEREQRCKDEYLEALAMRD